MYLINTSYPKKKNKKEVSCTNYNGPKIKNMKAVREVIITNFGWCTGNSCVYNLCAECHHYIPPLSP